MSTRLGDRPGRPKRESAAERRLRIELLRMRAGYERLAVRRGARRLAGAHSIALPLPLPGCHPPVPAGPTEPPGQWLAGVGTPAPRLAGGACPRHRCPRQHLRVATAKRQHIRCWPRGRRLWELGLILVCEWVGGGRKERKRERER